MTMAMKAFLSTAMTAVCLCLIGLLPTWAANPLSRAEQTVCRNLSHCLSILDDHPHDSFDYAVLAQEFTRFGDRGRKALIKRVSQGDTAKNRSASHAADLISIMPDEHFLAPLQALSDREKPQNQQDAARELAQQNRRVPGGDACGSRCPQSWHALFRAECGDAGCVRCLSS